MMFRPTLLLLSLAAVSATVVYAQTPGPASTPDTTYTQAQPAPIERSGVATGYSQQSGYIDQQQGPMHQPPQSVERPRNRAMDQHVVLAAGQLVAPRRGTVSAQPAAGLWLRVGHDSAVRAISLTTTPGDGKTELRVERGIANVTVHHPANGIEILVDLPGGQVSLVKDGLYTFNASTNTLRVLHGEARAYIGANTTGKGIKVKEDHQLVFAGTNIRSTDFDPRDARADLIPYAPRPNAAYDHGDGYGSGDYGEGFYPAYGFAPYGYPYYGFGYPFYDGFYPYGYGFGLGFGYGFYGGYGFHGGGFGGFHGRR